jgi:sugar/nucleoside kinase (ribokinase family)
MPPDLVVLGNLLVDDVVLGDGSTRMEEPGGAVLYCCLGAWLWGVRSGAVSRLGDDYPAWAMEALAQRGVDLAGVRAQGGPGRRVWLLYEDARRQIVGRLDRPSHLEVSPGCAEVPAEWRTASAVHVSPMPIEAQRSLVDALAGQDGVLVSLDPFGHVTAASLPAWRSLFAKVDVLFLGEDELELSFDSDLEIGRALAGGRLRYVVLKRASRGGALFDARTDRVRAWPARAQGIVDPTGAGDVFATSLLSGLLRGEDAEAALRRAVTGASFALEGFGPRGLLEASPEAAGIRLAAWFPS